jgi:hypothetical protein
MLTLPLRCISRIAHHAPRMELLLGIRLHTCKLKPEEVKVNWAGRCAVLLAYASKPDMPSSELLPCTSTPSILARPTAMSLPL